MTYIASCILTRRPIRRPGLTGHASPIRHPSEGWDLCGRRGTLPREMPACPRAVYPERLAWPASRRAGMTKNRKMTIHNGGKASQRKVTQFRASFAPRNGCLSCKSGWRRRQIEIHISGVLRQPGGPLSSFQPTRRTANTRFRTVADGGGPWKICRMMQMHSSISGKSGRCVTGIEAMPTPAHPAGRNSSPAPAPHFPARR